MLLTRPWAAPEIDVKTSNTASPLGIVPHQIRGFLSQFQNMVLTGAGYDKCTACSEAVLSQYRKDGYQFLVDVLKNPDYLETIAGLEEMKLQSEDVEVDWDDNESELE